MNKKTIGLLIASLVIAIYILPEISFAAHPYKKIHLGMSPSMGFPFVHDGPSMQARLNFRYKEENTVFLVFGSAGEEEYTTTGHYYTYYYDPYSGQYVYGWEEYEYDKSGTVDFFGVGFRRSFISFMPPKKSTFFKFDPTEGEFVFEPRLVRSAKPYVEGFVGSCIALGGGIEWQPITYFSADLGLNLGYSFTAEEENFFIMARLFLGFYFL